jgi:hypothetical protein
MKKRESMEPQRKQRELIAENFTLSPQGRGIG